MPLQPSLGELISSQRAALGLTQARLAELVGRSPSTIRSWERDRTAPADQAAVAALAAVLGLSEDEMAAAILGRAESPAPPQPAPVEQEVPQITEADEEATAESQPEAPSGGTHRAKDDVVDGSSPRVAGPDKTRAAAAPTVLSEVAPPRSEAAGAVSRLPRVPSYLDDPGEVRTYRVRTVLTAVLMILILIVLLWAFGEARESFGLIFDDPVLSTE